jgi:hypothetical protein
MVEEGLLVSVTTAANKGIRLPNAGRKKRTRTNAQAVTRPRNRPK